MTSTTSSLPTNMVGSIQIGSGLDRSDFLDRQAPISMGFLYEAPDETHRSDAWIGPAKRRDVVGSNLNNTLYSTPDDDRIDGLGGFDWASYFYSTNGVAVSLSIYGGQRTGMGTDMLVNIEGLEGSRFEDRLTGDAKSNDLYGLDGNDTLIGLAGRDFLSGGRGNDLLIGGADSDWLRGGAGADTFRYTDVSDTPVFTFVPRDRILDFKGREGDKVDLSRIDANSWIPGNQAFRFIGKGIPSIGEVGYIQTNEGITLFGQTVLSSVRNIQIDMPGISSISQSNLIL